ncbi:MAG: hypothetical protein ACD_15C00016G0005 [uncultured bacterium]|nr:MAG: hypothetical protein ACD_15C00016G0005 [uncultured bacterium]
MTKYILHGGVTREENELNHDFFSEIAGSLDDGDSLLLCYFAPSMKRDYPEKEKFVNGVKQFERYMNGKKVTYVFAEREDFMRQLKKTDAIYIHGGDTIKLLEDLKKYPEFPEEIRKKKLVVGSSAGAYVLAKYFINYSHENDAKQGFGILPIKIFCHFKDEQREILEEKFRKADEAEELELILLRDFEMKILEK